MPVADHYFISLLDPGHPEATISAQEYGELKAARAKLIAALRLEEGFEIVVATYIKFERFLLEQALEQMVRQRLHSFDTFSSIRLEINVLLSAFLAAARHYKDSAPQSAKACSTGLSTSEIIGKFSSQYDSSFDFRFMEAMRNYAQHSALPTDAVRIGDERDAGERRCFRLDVFSTKAALEKTSFKAKLLDEMPSRVDLRRCARYYLQGLATAHNEIRDLIGGPVEQAYALISRRCSDYFRSPLTRSGLAAIHYHGADKAGHIPLGVDAFNKRLSLMKDNKFASVVAEGYLTNELLPESEIPEPGLHDYG